MTGSRLVYSYIIIALTVARADDQPISFLTDSFIDFINSNQTLWRAGRNFAINTPLEYIKSLAGTIVDDTTDYVGIFDDAPTYPIDIKLPDSFDARQQWPNCPFISDIRDQGSCGSCWAVATAATISDRICIGTNGSVKFYFSILDPLSCCNGCGNCEGGYLFRAWAFCKRNGIVSGGKYKSYEGCRPYTIAPCDHHIVDTLKPCGGYERTPNCRKMCENTYKISYNADKKRCKKIFFLRNVFSAMSEIYLNGPISASYQVFEDFMDYKSGVYRHLEGKFLGNHSVKLIGWGVEQNAKYWLVANSWNEEWGDNGFFKILRGENHCGIEEHIAAGLI